MPAKSKLKGLRGWQRNIGLEFSRHLDRIEADWKTLPPNVLVDKINAERRQNQINEYSRQMLVKQIALACTHFGPPEPEVQPDALVAAQQAGSLCYVEGWDDPPPGFWGWLKFARGSMYDKFRYLEVVPAIVPAPEK